MTEGSSSHPDWRPDPLAPSRGCLLGLLVSFGVLLLVLLLVLWSTTRVAG